VGFRNEKGGETMKTNSEFKFPHFLLGIALGAIAALLLAPSPGEETWKYLRERSSKGLDYLNQQAGKLRQSAERVVRKGRNIVGSHRDSVDTATEAEKQAYQEERRETLGG
jgi:gas vesicle protein